MPKYVEGTWPECSFSKYSGERRRREDGERYLEGRRRARTNGKLERARNGGLIKRETKDNKRKGADLQCPRAARLSYVV